VGHERGILTGTDAKAAIQRYLAALNAHDPDAIVACVAADFVNEHTAVGARSRLGRSAYREALPVFLRDFADLRYVPEVLIAEQGRVAAPYRMSFRHRPSGGKPVQIRGIFVFELDQAGLIKHRIDYWDSGEVARQLADPDQ
jgi:steroid delta-isomerase-like uncharacterized protein